MSADTFTHHLLHQFHHFHKVRVCGQVLLRGGPVLTGLNIVRWISTEHVDFALKNLFCHLLMVCDHLVEPHVIYCHKVWKPKAPTYTHRRYKCQIR